MTLKEKFLPFVDDIDLINDIPNEEWALRNANKCIEIADEFAIGFAEWTHNLRDCEEDSIEFNQYINISSEELLEIYKKEKGL